MIASQGHFKRLLLAWELFGDEAVSSHGSWPTSRVLAQLLAERRWDDARRWSSAAAAAAEGGLEGQWEVTQAQASALAADSAELDWLTPEERAETWEACHVLFLGQVCASGVSAHHPPFTSPH